MIYLFLACLLIGEISSVDPEYTIGYTFHGLENIDDVDEAAFLRDPYGTLTECWDRGCDNVTITMTLVELKQTAPWSRYEEDFFPILEGVGRKIGWVTGIPGAGFVGKTVGKVVGKVLCAFGCNGKADPPPDDVPPVVVCPITCPVYTDKLALTAEMMFPKARAVDDVDGDVSHNLTLEALAGQLIPNEVMPGIYIEEDAPHDYYVYRFKAQDKGNNIGFCDFQINIILVSCERPDPIDNGFHLADTYLYGAHVDFVCNTGYTMQGSNSSECEKKLLGKGEWSHDTPSCPAIRCPELQDIAYGNLSCWHVDGGEACSDSSCQYLSQCRYSCAPGFQIPASQRAHLVCEQDGEWNGPVPQCKDYEPPRLRSCPASIVQEADQFVTSAPVSWTPPEYTDNSGQDVDIIMLEGHEPGSSFEEGTHQIMYAGVDPSGNRNTECSFKVDVRVNRCQKLMATVFMEDPICSHGNIYGSLCTFSCLSGADLLGSDNATCSIEGDPPAATWTFSDDTPSCRARPCATLSSPQHGHLYCGQWFEGDMCEPTCSDQYSLPFITPIMYHCGLLQGTWQPAVPMEDCTPLSSNNGFYKTYELFFNNVPSEEDFSAALSDSMEDVCTNICTYTYLQTSQGYDVFYELDGTPSIDETDAIFENIEQSLLLLVDSMPLQVHSDNSVVSSAATVRCHDGLVPSFVNNGCVGCPAGQFYDTVQQNCSLCPIGSYQDEHSQLTCNNCPAGSSTKEEGASSVEDCKDFCKSGEISSDGMPPCEPCSRGTYLPTRGGNSCVPCVPGTTTVTEGANKETLCQTFDMMLDHASEQTVDDLESFTMGVWLYLDPLHDCNVLVYETNDDDLTVAIHDGTLHIENEEYTIPLLKWSHLAVVKESTAQLHLNGQLLHESSNIYGDGKLMMFPGAICEGLITALNVWNYPVNDSERIKDSTMCHSESEGNALSWTDIINQPYVALSLHESLCDDFDECQSNPCVHGTCNDHLRFFTCTCDDDYEGELCEIKINHCEEHDCKNGATCVDGYMNYTCQCADEFSGFYCDDTKVNGGWSEWREWTECSRTCGFGSKARSRDCINPVPEFEGMPCPGESTETSSCIRRSCPECIPIRAPEYGNVTCEDDGEDILCEVFCLYNFEFMVPVSSNMTCGPSTNYMWPTQTNPHQKELTLPACTFHDMPTNLSIHNELVYPTLDCDSIPSKSEDIMAQKITDQFGKIKCVDTGTCHIDQIHVDCAPSTKLNMLGMHGTKVSITLQTDVEIPEPIAHLTETNREVNITTKELFQFGDEAGHNLADAIEIVESAGEQIEKEMEDNQFAITIDGIEYKASDLDIVGEFTCQQGTVYRDKMCVVCPMGTYQSVFCVLCSPGMYQSYEGQRTCRQCEDGTTTLNKGATSEDECVLYCRAGTYNQDLTCLTCPAGTYQPSEMQSTCKQCGEGLTSPEGATIVQQCQKRPTSHVGIILGSVCAIVITGLLITTLVSMKKRKNKVSPAAENVEDNNSDNLDMDDSGGQQLGNVSKSPEEEWKFENSPLNAYCMLDPDIYPTAKNLPKADEI